MACCLACHFAIAPARSADNEKVRQSIAQAVKYLRANYKFDQDVIDKLANPDDARDKGIAICGVALLEAGVSPKDPLIGEIAKIVREASIDEDRTYQPSWDIIFLDKLGDEIDTRLIQSIAARLVMGQSTIGGWANIVPKPDDEETKRLRNLLLESIPKPKGIFIAARKSDFRPEMDPVAAEILKGKRMKPFDGIKLTDDNSNTMFAAIALWAARRHGIPAELALGRVESRFLASQINDGWANQGIGPQQIPTPAMICAGLIGLTIGNGVRRERTMKTRATIGPDGKLKIDGSKPKPPPNPLLMPAMQGGLAFLGKAIIINQATSVASEDRSIGPNQELVGAIRQDLYFLWSLENVCVILNVKNVGGRNWYDWGCEWLLAHQIQDGSFQSKWGKRTDTSLALMFLVRANIMRDLSSLLKTSGEIKPSEKKTAQPPSPCECISIPMPCECWYQTCQCTRRGCLTLRRLLGR